MKPKNTRQISNLAPPCMPGKAGQPFSGKRKNKHRQKTSSKHKAQKKEGTLPPSKLPKHTPTPAACSCKCKEHTGSRREKRLERVAGTLRVRCKLHLATARFEKNGHRATVRDFDKNFVQAPFVSNKPFATQSAPMQALTMGLASQALEQLRMHYGFTLVEFTVAITFWNHVYGGGPVPSVARDEKEQEQEPGAPAAQPTVTGHKGRSTIWREEWEKMHLLRGIADEIVVSSVAMRRIFLVLGVAGLSGGQLDRMKSAMNLAVASRIKIHDLLGPGGENVGVWLDVSDVIRQMIISANGRPGVEYNIVLTGDGRWPHSTLLFAFLQFLQYLQLLQ